jgi:hypothetical protein
MASIKENTGCCLSSGKHEHGNFIGCCTCSTNLSVSSDLGHLWTLRLGLNA